MNQLSCQFTVSGALVSEDVDVIINIFRRRENINFRKKAYPSETNIAYLRSAEARANNTLTLTDRSTVLANNRIQSDIDYILASNVITYTIETDNFVLTDQFTEETNTTDVIPLFYQHIIGLGTISRISDDDMTIQSSTVLGDVRVLDKDGEVLDLEEILVDYDKGIIYNNLENTYDKTSTDYEAYYVQYTINVSGTIQTYTEILSNQEIYTVADFDDLDEDLELINDGRKVYLIDKTDDGYSITFPAYGDYAFSILGKARIKILPFDNLSIENPWYARILNGSFFYAIGGNNYIYEISEFSDQPWNPEFPYKKATDEESVVVSSNLIKLNRSFIYQSSDDSLYIDILINDQYDEGVAAYTTNPSNDGVLASNDKTYVYWDFTDKEGIRSVDTKTGFLDIEGITLLSSYKVYSTYYFEEIDLEYTNIDLNPLNNPSVSNNRVVFFLDPNTSTDIKAQTVFYMLVDEKGRVIESSHEDFDNDVQALTNGHQLYYEDIPDYMTAIVPVDTESFIDDYSVEGSGTYLVLGEVNVDYGFALEDTKVIDSRVAGGGIISSFLSAAKEKNREVNYYWDIGYFDGVPYPGTAAYLVEIPVEVLDGAGGVFTQKQVKDIVDKHTALGVYPIVRAYGIDPIPTDVVPHSNSIRLDWRSYGSDVLYNVYYSTDSGGPWTKATASLLADNPHGNTYTITGLLYGTIYYVMIVGGKYDDDGIWVALSGQPIGPKDLPAIELENKHLAIVRTFGPTISTSDTFGNSFEVI